MEFEYIIVESDDLNFEDNHKSAELKLNKLGADGWELVLQDGSSYCLIFKRMVK